MLSKTGEGQIPERSSHSKWTSPPRQKHKQGSGFCCRAQGTLGLDTAPGWAKTGTQTSQIFPALGGLQVGAGARELVKLAGPWG